MKCPYCNINLVKNSEFGIKEINEQMYVIFVASCKCKKEMFYVKMKIDTENIETYK